MSEKSGRGGKCVSVSSRDVFTGSAGGPPALNAEGIQMPQLFILYMFTSLARCVRASRPRSDSKRFDWPEWAYFRNRATFQTTSTAGWKPVLHFINLKFPARCNQFQNS